MGTANGSASPARSSRDDDNWKLVTGYLAFEAILWGSLVFAGLLALLFSRLG